MFNEVLNPLLRPLLDGVGPLLTILIVSIFVSLLTTLVYKFTTDQTKLKSLRADMKRYQKKMKANQDNPEKVMKIQKDMMKLNGELMKQSLRSTLYTFIPILLFFGWMQANLAFAPLLPDEPFQVTLDVLDGVQDQATLILPDGLTTLSNETQSPDVKGMVSWTVSGIEGLYDLKIRVGEEEQIFSVIISQEVLYVNPVHTFDESAYFSTITVSNEKLRMFVDVPVLNKVPVIKNLNWFWTYFLFSMIFSMSLRKALKIA